MKQGVSVVNNVVKGTYYGVLSSVGNLSLIGNTLEGTTKDWHDSTSTSVRATNMRMDKQTIQQGVNGFLYLDNPIREWEVGINNTIGTGINNPLVTYVILGGYFSFDTVINTPIENGSASMNMTLESNSVYEIDCLMIGDYDANADVKFRIETPDTYSCSISFSAIENAQEHIEDCEVTSDTLAVNTDRESIRIKGLIDTTGATGGITQISTRSGTAGAVQTLLPQTYCKLTKVN
jgi:hypothetical protein